MATHNMARANLNKSEKFLTNTTEASKYIPNSFWKMGSEKGGGIYIDADLGPPLDMYFDAAAVLAKNVLLLFRLALAILWYS